MAEFHTLLTYDNSALVESGDKESVVDAVKAAVCQNINLLVTRDEEEFSEFLSTFVQDVWTQLVQVSVRPNQVITHCCAACSFLAWHLPAARFWAHHACHSAYAEVRQPGQCHVQSAFEPLIVHQIQHAELMANCSGSTGDERNPVPDDRL